MPVIHQHLFLSEPDTVMLTLLIDYRCIYYLLVRWQYFPTQTSSQRALLIQKKSFCWTRLPIKVIRIIRSKLIYNNEICLEKVTLNLLPFFFDCYAHHFRYNLVVTMPTIPICHSDHLFTNWPEHDATLMDFVNGTVATNWTLWCGPFHVYNLEDKLFNEFCEIYYEKEKAL